MNVGGIYIRVKPRLTAARVRAAITAYWTERGAKPAKVTPGPLALAKTKQLAFAVLPAKDWICIADSERYTADFALATALAEVLGTQVIWYALYGATSAGALRVIGGRKAKTPDDTYADVEDYVATKLPHAFVYLDKLGAPDTLGFERVDPARYDRGPTPAEEEEFEPIASPAGTVDDPATWPVQVARELVEEGELRIGHLVAFFMAPGFKAHAAAVAKVLDRWLALVPRQALTWSRIGASASSRKPFNPQTIGRAKQQLAPKTKRAYFELGGPEQANPQYHFELSGGANDDFARRRGWANALRIYFPWRTPHERLVDFANEVATTLDHSSGLVTPAVAFDNIDSKSRGRAAAGRLVARYAGLELQVDGFDLGDRMHGAHWLVYLGAKLAKTIGKKPGLLRASERPEVGDLLAGPIPEGLRTMARTLAPILAPGAAFARQAAPLQCPQLDDGIADTEALEGELRELWQQRFYEDEARLRELAAGFERLARAETGELELDVPYVSKQLAARLVTTLHDLVAAKRFAAAEKLLARAPAAQLLAFLRYDALGKSLADSPLLPWLAERAKTVGETH